MTEVLMRCGHQANATNTAGEPCCAICAGLTVEAEIPSDADMDALCADRIARCGCGLERPSSDRARLAFFEYLGPGSSHAADHCRECGHTRNVHGLAGYEFWRTLSTGERMLVTVRAHSAEEATRDAFDRWGTEGTVPASDLEPKPLKGFEAAQGHEFEPGATRAKDRFYCGHSGWD